MAASLGFGDRYLVGTSALHRADARLKLVATVGYIFAVAFIPIGQWLALAMLAIPVVLAIVAAQLSPRVVLLRTVLALPFMLAAVPLLFTKAGDEVATVPLLGWEVTDEGTRAVTTILAKAWISVAAAVVLTATSQSADLVRGLRALRVPRLLAATVMLAYRYLHVIGDEGRRLMRARESRSAARAGMRAGRGVGWRASVLGGMVGSLFLRSVERSERVYAAMQARGFDGEVRVLNPSSIATRDLVAGAAILVYAAAVAVGANV